MLSSRTCASCQSGNLRDFLAEMNIHFSGIKGINVPSVWLFPTILVCMDCGMAQFTIPEAERGKLQKGLSRLA